MGYTHYWDQLRSFSDEEWKLVTTGFNILVEKYDGKLGDWEGEGDPNVSDDLIAFNGADDSYETFCMKKTKVDFNFCKTARKPYDEAVTAFLIIIDALVPDILSIRSDGDTDGEEWDLGRHLAKIVLDELETQCRI